MLAIALIGAAASISVTGKQQKFVDEVVPKLLFFEKLAGRARVSSVEDSSEPSKFAGSFDNRNFTAYAKSDVNGSLDPIWCQSDDHDGWAYSKPNESIEQTSMKYMEMLVNSMNPPSLVRITSHRSKADGRLVFHELTLIISLYGRRSLQYIEYKVNASGRDSFVSHSVVLQESDWP